MHLGDILTTARIERQRRETQARHAAICRAFRSTPRIRGRLAALLRSIANRLDAAPTAPLDVRWFAWPRRKA